MAQADIPDHCWQPTYKNDGRKWLITAETDLKTNASAMKEQFRHPSIYKTDRHSTAKRRELIRNQMIAEVTEEIAREKAMQNNAVDYCTTYDEKFRIPGFRVNDELPEHSELHLKYPLYTSNPVSVWSEMLKSAPREITPLAGTTKITDPRNPFKRNGKFSTPVNQRLDEPEI
ncbi:hypothetical protein CBL_12643 [Carabus blaptoides fortunei]